MVVRANSHERLLSNSVSQLERQESGGALTLTTSTFTSTLRDRPSTEPRVVMELAALPQDYRCVSVEQCQDISVALEFVSPKFFLTSKFSLILPLILTTVVCERHKLRFQ